MVQRSKESTDPLAKRLDALRLKKTNFNKTKSVVARPVLSMRFFLPFTAELDDTNWLCWNEVPASMCEVIGQYLAAVHELAPHVHWFEWQGSAMTPATRTRLCTSLEKRPRIIEWDGRIEGDENIGPYGVSALFSSSAHTLGTWPKRVASLRFDFPTVTAPSIVAELFTRFAMTLPLQSADAGFMFREEPARWNGRVQVLSKLRQSHYLGIGPGLHSIGNSMAGHTYSATWKHALSDDFARSVAGDPKRWPDFVKAQREELNGTWILGSSEQPLAGALVKGHRELGGLPEVAAFLRPARMPMKSDALQAWLARFDDVE